MKKYKMNESLKKTISTWNQNFYGKFKYWSEQNNENLHTEWIILKLFQLEIKTCMENSNTD